MPGLLDGLTPEQRRKRSAGLLAEQWEPGYSTPAPMLPPEGRQPWVSDGDLLQRSELFPAGIYQQPDGSKKIGLAWPGILSGEMSVPGDHSPEAGEAYARTAVSNALFPSAVGRAASPVVGNSLGTFGGRLAKTADHAALAKAESLAASGIPREQIWNETGWFKGPDQKWKFEIDDSGLTTREGHTGVGRIVHPELRKAYPGRDQRWLGEVGQGDPTGAYMEFGGKDRIGPYSHIEVSGRTPQEQRQIASHELQHHAQNQENFARGGSPMMFIGDNLPTPPGFRYPWMGDPMEKYRRLAGETEARAVEKRMDLTPEQRSARPPWLDYDVPESEQIVRFADGSGISQKSYSSDPPIEGFPTIKGNVMFAIRAFHGSPHDFDRFDLSKIGTGEGAQAFGHGLYFAEREGVARSYRDNLSKSKTIVNIGGTDYDWTVPGTMDKLRAAAAERASSAGLDPAAAQVIAERLVTTDSVKAAVDQAQKMPWTGVTRKNRAAYEGLFQDASATTQSSGRMYEVSINADPEHFLDWDKPLSQQSKSIEKLLKEHGGQQPHVAEAWPPSPDGDYAIKYADGTTGHERFKSYDDAQAWLTNNPLGNGRLEQYLVGDSQRFTNAARELGIPGIKYLDQGSRTAGEGSRNYVVFDPAIIDILKKYGLLGMLGAGGAGYAASPDQAQAKGLLHP